MALREISRVEFQRLAYNIATTLPASDVAWFATADDCLLAVVLHDHSAKQFQYVVYRRKWGICEQVAQAGGFDGRPNAALLAQVELLAKTVHC
jgi:hypothetical protein